MKEAEGRATDVFVGVLLEHTNQERDERRGMEAYQIIPNGIPKADAQKHQRAHAGYPKTNSHNKNHLLLQLPVVVVLWTDFPVEMQQLL